ncbi:MAG: carboxypeptidase regulatory-like domain-containing protein [Anaerolineae bacterium]|nr:carboxypeptidase regulatory-like domain-containing protein [Anaerolineae bacterium]
MIGKHWYWKLLLVGLLFVGAAPVVAQAGNPPAPPSPFQAVIGTAVQADVSPPLREMMAPAPKATEDDVLQTSLRLPRPLVSVEPLSEDPLRQSVNAMMAMPAPLYSFNGVGNVNGVHPPDTQGDIGYDPATGVKYYVQWVNLSFAIWDVTGATPTLLYGPVSGNSIWQGFGGPCQTTNNGDPITLFDPLANRWLMSQFSINGPYYQCIAISQTADPTGAWYRYAFQVSATKMNDYPHFGVWPDGYYMTVNQFTGGSSWGGAGVFVFDRAKMLTGDPTATFQSFDLYSVNFNYGGMLPADMDGTTPPPAGAPNYFVEVDVSPPEIKFWRFHVDWANPANTTFGINGNPNATIPVAAWAELCPSTRACIPQPGTSYRLDGLGDRLMYRAAYRNFDSHEVLLLNHSVNAGSGVAGVRWYELRNLATTPTMYQQSTYAPDSDNRWMGSIAMDAMGNVALGYSVSSSSVYPSVRYTGRLANDPLGQMSQGEATLVAGSGVQESQYSRWGDYSMMSVDPEDDCTFWFTQEYMQTTGYNTWSTRIGAFRFPNCTQAAPGMLRGTVTNASTGAALSGVSVAAQIGNAAPQTTVSAVNGAYGLSLPENTYTVTAGIYGYNRFVQTNVAVIANTTATLNIALTPLARYVVSGTVTDAVTGWPLHARVRVQGSPFSPPAPDNAVWTDPVTGIYSMTLAANMAYTLTVEPWISGYAQASAVLGSLTGSAVRNFALQPNLVTCNAPGYVLSRVPVAETSFSSGQPSGWLVGDQAGTGAVWLFTDPKNRTNLTGGTGGFAIVDSDYAGNKAVNTSLRSPSWDMSAESEVILEFKYDFRWYAYGGSEIAEADVSTDGGVTWATVWHRSGASDRGPKTARVDISALAAGESDVRVRFHYYDAQYDWWWQIDDVFVGTVECQPAPGGLVVGNITDANTGAPVTAKVSGASGSTTAQLSAGQAFYSLFVPLGATTITATAQGYGPVSLTPSVTQNTTTRQDFVLPAGVLEPAPFPSTITMMEGTTVTHYLTLTNAGGYVLDFNVQPVNAPVPTLEMGPFAPATRRVSPKYVHDLNAKTSRADPLTGVPLWPDGGTVLQTWSSGLAAPWGIEALPDGSLWINDTRLGGGSNKHYHFSSGGALLEDGVDTFAQAVIFAADMTYDPVANTIWQVNVGEDNCIYELDAATALPTGQVVCPGFGLSERGLAYDPVSDTFFSGSWNDQILHHFNRQGEILASWDVKVNIAGLAYNPVSGHLFVTSNAEAGYDVIVLDARNQAALLGGFDIPGLGDYEQASLALDSNGDLWAVNQITGDIIQVTSGEPFLPWSQIPWLQVSPMSGTLATGGDQTLALTFGAAGMLEGAYPAYLRLDNSAPYESPIVPVTMVVVYPYGVMVTPATAAASADPGATAIYTFSVRNTGNNADSYDVTLSGHTWAAEASVVTVGPLASDAEAQVTVEVTVPSGALCGAHDAVTVTVTSQGNASRNGTIVLTTTANPVYAIMASAVSDQLWGDPGATVSTTLRVTNAGNCPATFNLEASGHWSVSLPAVQLSLAAGEQGAATVSVRVPATAHAGDSDMTTLTVSAAGVPAQPVDVTLLTVANAVYALLLDPIVAQGQGVPGADVLYTFAVTNQSNAPVTVSLATVDSTWLAAVQPLSLPLAIGATAPATVTVSIPEAAVPGASDALQLAATTGNTTTTASVTTTAVVSYGVTLQADPETGETLPGSSVAYTVWVTNTGGYSDTFDLAVSGNVWTTTVPASVGPLAPGAGQAVAVTVEAPDDAVINSRDTVTLTATSRSDVAVSASLALTTTAVDCLSILTPSFTYLPAPPLAGKPVTFTGAVAAGSLPITYTWSFGDGAFGEGQVVSHTYTDGSGLIPYRVVMTATNACSFASVEETLTPVSSNHLIYLPLVVRSYTGE